jgi:hypothetical protein
MFAAVAVGACAAAAVLAAIPAKTSADITRASSQRPLATGFLDPASFGGPDQRTAYEHARRAGTKYVRIRLDWAQVAPGGAVKPSGFRARDHASSHYDWSALDREVRGAAASGFIPIVYIQDAPKWAEDGRAERANDGPVRPSPTELADFATALARRYDGRRLPRVRYWQVWNEPNLSIELMPQSEDGKPLSPGWYRAMVNAVAKAVHAVRRDNVVIAGGLAPFGGDINDPSGGPVPDQERVHPLEFMREMLCVSKGRKPKPTCSEDTEFDVWAHHPYTYGGPTHKAFHPDDVSLGDLREMRRVLEAAEAAGHVETTQNVRFWVTEFSYDSRPADPKGLPAGLHARWTSEALYRMWKNGVSLVTWFLLRDQAFPQEMFQSGLYFRGQAGIESDKPKPALKAFRFPFVAFLQKDGSIRYWGRTPSSTRKAVVVEQKKGARWVRLVLPKVDRYGIFQGKLTKVGGRGPLRVRLTDRSDISLPFSLAVPKDFRFCPWGSFC